MILAALSPKQYDEHREKLRPFIKEALDRGGEETLTEVEISIREGRRLPVIMSHDVFSVMQGMMLLELNPDAVHVVTLSGKFSKGWMSQVFTSLVSIAKSQKKGNITLKGRKGWRRALKPLGFTDIGNGFTGVKV